MLRRRVGAIVRFIKGCNCNVKPVKDRAQNKPHQVKLCMNLKHSQPKRFQSCIRICKLSFLQNSLLNVWNSFKGSVVYPAAYASFKRLLATMNSASISLLNTSIFCGQIVRVILQFPFIPELLKIVSNIFDFLLLVAVIFTLLMH